MTSKRTLFATVFAMAALGLCAANMNVYAQTASPGPGSRNANVDNEDPNKPNTEDEGIPAQEAPGGGDNREHGAAGERTPSGGDGSVETKNRNPTQPIDGNLQSVKDNGEDAARDASTDKDTMDAKDKNQKDAAAKNTAPQR